MFVLLYRVVVLSVHVPPKRVILLCALGMRCQTAGLLVLHLLLVMLLSMDAVDVVGLHQDLLLLQGLLLEAEQLLENHLLLQGDATVLLVLLPCTLLPLPRGTLRCLTSLQLMLLVLRLRRVLLVLLEVRQAMRVLCQ